ncbi:glycosyltransferase family 4 protein [Marinobacterium jannaschii]|uniref:glycosyltransferase family 4 protein n=1 Tax=Marinobacterium jannaschii TaxID=64970 RepID=UPI0006885D5F|nr:glycosyltransferase family 4 protein [Marinobacterium jannaschii]
MAKVVFLNSVFPVLSETFLFSQYSSLLSQKLPMVLVANNRPAPDQVHPGMEEIQQQVDYLCDASVLTLLLAHLWILVRHPVRYFGCLLKLFSSDAGAKASLAHITGAALVLRRYSGSRPLWIHAHFTYGAASVAMWAQRLSGVPYSLTLHGSDLTFDDAPDLAEKLASASEIISISEYNRRYIAEHFPAVDSSRIRVIPMGVKPLPETPVRQACRGDGRSSALKLLNVGRLSNHKAQHILIEACARLRQQGVAFSLDIIGEGDYRPRLEALIDQHQLGDQVRLLGPRFHSEVLAAYAAADLFVLSSVAEGMPVVLMEAMQAGVPVVATEISGIPELLDYGRGGVLVPPGDVTALADALCRIANGELELKQKQEYAMQHIQKQFDEDKNSRYFGQFLNGLLASQGE